MRQISGPRREERIRGRSDDAANASFPSAPQAGKAPPSVPRTAPKNFTAQVMARLTTPATPDPEFARIQRARKRARFFARVYITLILLAALGAVLIALFAPWALAAGLSKLVALGLYIFSALAYIGRSTGGFVNWTSAIYALMLVALAPILALLWRRTRRKRARAWH
jgi:hypothetical protein